MEVFDAKKAPKAHAHMMHVPQFIAYTKFPLGFTTERRDGSSTLVLRSVVPQVSHQ